METAVIRIDKDTPDPGAIARAGEILRAGGLVAFPTETVYGLGGDALNPEASRKIYEAKGRPSDNPLIVHIARMEDAELLSDALPEDFYALGRKLWPGPLTIIVPASDRVPRSTTGGLSTVAIRFPSHPVAQALILAGGGYVAAPSANRSGRPSTTSAEDCIQDLSGRVDMILDSGPVGIGVESTIVDLTGEIPALLRPGKITPQRLAEILGKPVIHDGAVKGQAVEGAPKAPGMKYRHYAPKGVFTLVRGEVPAVRDRIVRELEQAHAEGYRTGVLCFADTAPAFDADCVAVLGPRGDLEEAARNLFRALRSFDENGIDRIWGETTSEEGVGLAVMNRLTKAAGGRIVDAI